LKNTSECDVTKFLRLINSGGSLEQLIQEFTLCISAAYTIKGCLILMRTSINKFELSSEEGLDNSFYESTKVHLAKLEPHLYQCINNQEIRLSISGLDFSSEKASLQTSIVPIVKNSFPIGCLVLLHSEMKGDQNEIIKNLLTFSEFVSLYLNGNQIPAKDPDLKFNHLTERQKELLKYLCHDFTSQEIAKLMNFSNGTIRQETSKIYAILGVKTRQQAAFVAQRILQ
jgi:DNA-binding CsgD family transcriptional regulator